MTDVTKATLIRIVSALIMVPVYLLLIVTDWLRSTPILVCSVVITLVCLYEYYAITDRGEEGRPFVAAGMAFAVALNVVIYCFAFGGLYGYGRNVFFWMAGGIVALFLICALGSPFLDLYTSFFLFPTLFC
jgi:hypothetical protein